MISTYARTVSPRATKFGIATHIRQKRISSGRVTPYPKGAGPQRPLDFGGPLLLPTWFDVARPNWIVTHVTWGRSVFLGASHAPVTKERVLSVPRNFWDIYLRPNGLTLSDQIWYGIAHVGSSVFLGRQSRPVLKGGWAYRPKKWGSFTCAHTVWETATEFCMFTLANSCLIRFIINNHTISSMPTAEWENRSLCSAIRRIWC